MQHTTEERYSIYLRLMKYWGANSKTANSSKYNHVIKKLREARIGSNDNRNVYWGKPCVRYK